MKCEDAKKHQVKNSQVPQSSVAARSGSVRGSRRRANTMPASATAAGISIQSLSRPKMPLRKRPGPRGTATVPGCALVVPFTGVGTGLHPGWSSVAPVIRSVPL